MLINGLVIHIPHASLCLPPDKLGTLYVGYEEVKTQALLQADLFCDELFDFAACETVKTDYSRFICDVERFKDDAHEPMSRRGQGMFYTHFEDGTCFRGTELREKIEKEIYDVHHAALEAAVERALITSSYCLIIDCHSFGLSGDQPDICIGSDSYHTPEKLQARVFSLACDMGYSVAVNTPYAGSIVPAKHYKKDRRVSSIMIELNRKLYLTSTFEKARDFEKTKRFCIEILSTLAALYGT